ncbi:MAG: hypothetical protein KIS66_08745 [Fimbriimonadaceae bacterium]|nr:hypothetical protein [Fimbriimonadaceae bacterium]
MDVLRLSKRPSAQGWAVRVTLAFFALLIIACGGGGDTAGSHYPLTSHVDIVGFNMDADNIHFVVNGEAYDASNRVTPAATVTRSTAASYTWNDASSVVSFTVKAGRNGSDLDSKTISMTGDQRMNNMKIRAVWNGSVVTVSLVH